jgi:hypothetical protein
MWLGHFMEEWGELRRSTTKAKAPQRAEGQQSKAEKQTKGQNEQKTKNVWNSKWGGG